MQVACPFGAGNTPVITDSWYELAERGPGTQAFHPACPGQRHALESHALPQNHSSGHNLFPVKEALC